MTVATDVVARCKNEREGEATSLCDGFPVEKLAMTVGGTRSWSGRWESKDMGR